MGAIDDGAVVSAIDADSLVNGTGACESCSAAVVVNGFASDTFGGHLRTIRKTKFTPIFCDSGKKEKWHESKFNFKTDVKPLDKLGFPNYSNYFTITIITYIMVI